MKNVIDIVANAVSTTKDKTEQMKLKVLGLLLVMVATDKKAQA